MADDFKITASRMFKSSEILHNQNAYHNSCYLAGYVVECYTKLIVIKFGRNNPRAFSHNINSLNTELQSILSGDSTLSQYIIDGAIDFNTIRTRWNPEIRYTDLVSFSNNAMSQLFQNEMTLAMQKITKLEVDGII